MFIRSVKIKSSSGTVHEYVRLVSSVRENGKVKQKVVANLGKRDLIESILPMLNRFFSGTDSAEKLTKELGQDSPIEVLDASTWGPALVVRFLFDQLGLWQILEQAANEPDYLDKEEKRDDWISRVYVLVANRLCCPSSEHGLAAWLESDFLCDRHGRGYMPCWKQNKRVQVDFNQLARWYRTLDRLIINQSEIELAIYYRLRDLFSLNPDFVLYDITSTYFEGHGPETARHGYSRDRRPRNVQVVIGVVMVGGWPIAHHVWAGNTRDETTVPEVLADLMKRFQFRQVVFVGDRGMVSDANFKVLENPLQDQDMSGDVENAFGFLLGMTRRRNPEAEKLIDRIDESAWIECPAGINAQEKQESPRTRVQEVESDRPGVRVLVVDSEERRSYEQRQREKSMTRVREALNKVRIRVQKGRLKKPEKIGAAVERALKKSHGHRYYTWELKDGELCIIEHPVNLPREKKYEGKYLIQTDQKEITALEAVKYYKELADVEWGFRCLKDPLSMRPIYHRTSHRVEAHIFVSALAFLLDRMLDRRLKESRSRLSTKDAWNALQTIRHVSFKVNGKTRTGVTPGVPRAREVLKALGITQVRPPVPPPQQLTTM